MLFHFNLTHAWSEDGQHWQWASHSTADLTVKLQNGRLQARKDHERPRVTLTADGDLKTIFVSSQNPDYGPDGAEILAFATKAIA